MAQLPNLAAPAPEPGTGRARYEGAWARLQVFEADPQHGVQQVPDPRHRVRGAVDPAPSWQAPVYPDTGANEETVGLAAFDVPPLVPVIDRTTPGHDAGYVGDAYSSQAALQAAHNKDEGADRWHSYTVPGYDFFDEHYYDIDMIGSPAPAIALAHAHAAPYLRGINSSPVNNVGNERNRPGRSGVVWRPGVYNWHNVNRDFSPPRRQHDYRWVRPNVVTVIGDAPPPVKPDRYSSPFTSLQRFVTDIKPRPMVRRIPAPFDEDLIHDGSDAAPQASVGMTGW